VKRTAAVLMLLSVLSAARGQTKPGDPIHLTVGPADGPKPMQKYRLLPDKRDLAPGNAAAQYYRAYGLFYENPSLLREVKESYWYDWLETPLDDLPKKEMHDKLSQARHFIREIEVGARRRDCDWQLEGREEGIGLLLPDVQGFRTVGVLLAARARLEIAEGRFDDAVRTLQSGYALARHLGRGPSPIHTYVGGAVAGQMSAQLDELLRQPGAPNLYWALAELPRPFIDPAPGIEEDGRFLDNMFPWLKRLDGPPMTEVEIQAGVLAFRKKLDDLGVAATSEPERLLQAAQLVQAHGDAKKRLLAREKYKAEQVEAMPLVQAVALAAYLDYRESFDEMTEWARVPGGIRHAGYKKAVERYNQAVARLDRLFFRNLLGSVGAGGDFVTKVYETAERVQRRLAALACVEALRMHAARTGKWPASLDDLSDVPVPVDPVTGKSFEYSVRDDTATVTTPPIGGVKGTPTSAVKYEVTLRK
jgi:hypothetical protein